MSENQLVAPPLRAAEAWHGAPVPAPREPDTSSRRSNDRAEGTSAQFLTGDENVDQDILAFFKAKEELLKRSKGSRN